MKNNCDFFVSLVLAMVFLGLPTTVFAAEIYPLEKTNIGVTILEGDHSPYLTEPLPPRPFIEKAVHSSIVLPQTGVKPLNWWSILIGCLALALGLGRYIYCYQKRRKRR